MDGIPVKINEKYKPPPVRTLPACILNRLNNVQFSNYTYDFTLENTVAQHMTRLNSICREEMNRRRTRAETSPETTENGAPTILTPVPISSKASGVIKSEKKSPFKYSDFENDTSSPFDNEELKTLNDLEELAHVLGASTGGCEVPQWPSPNFASVRPFCQYDPTTVSSASHTAVAGSCQAAEDVRGNDEDGRLKDVVRSLQEYIGQRKIASVAPLSRDSPSSPPPSLFALPEQQQQLARRVSDMGFPLARTVEAVKTFGPDETKVVEYLLLVQSFVDKGYPESQTIHALDINQCDEIQTENYLRVLDQIMRLGFKEDEVVNALARTKNDRDKALDILIS